jgi:hypothetical protein
MEISFGLGLFNFILWHPVYFFLDSFSQFKRSASLGDASARVSLSIRLLKNYHRDYHFARWLQHGRNVQRKDSQKQ